MMKRLALYLALAVVAVFSQAQVLWKVSGNGLNKDSYIIGTIHILPVKVIDIIPGMDTALKNCEIVIGETDIEDIDEPKWYIVPSDSTLDKLYSAEEYRFIQGALNRITGHNQDFSRLNNYKPAKILLELYYMRAIKDYILMENTDFIDDGIKKRAIDMGCQSMGLETADFQNQLINDAVYNTPLDMQAKGLLDFCKDSRSEEAIKELVKPLFQNIGAYVLQNFEYFESNSETKNDELILKSRNLGWIPKLEAIMPEKSCLVVVGIGHLVGEYGVLQLLRKQGYTVEPMK